MGDWFSAQRVLCLILIFILCQVSAAAPYCRMIYSSDSGSGEFLFSNEKALEAIEKSKGSAREFWRILKWAEAQSYDNVFWEIIKFGPRSSYKRYLARREALPLHLQGLVASMRQRGWVSGSKTDEQLVQEFFARTNFRQWGWSLSAQLGVIALSHLYLKAALGPHLAIPVDLPQLRLKDPRREYILNVTSKLYDRLAILTLVYFVWSEALCHHVMDSCLIAKLKESSLALNSAISEDIKRQINEYQILLRTENDPEKIKTYSLAIQQRQEQLKQLEQILNKNNEESL